MSLANTLDELIKQVALQETTTDQVVRRDVIREFVYKGADLLTDARIIAPEASYDGLDVKTEFPSEIEVDYPVAEGAVGKEGRITWTPFNLILERAEGSFKITDEATIRQKEKMQYQWGIKKLARAFAKKKNNNILSAVVAGYTGSTATSGAWDGGTPKIVEDVNKAIAAILESDAADIGMEDLKKMVVALPLKAFNLISALTEINNLKTTYRDFLETEYGFKIVPFKELSTSSGLGGGNDMYVCVGGEETAKHGVYRGGAVPLTEEKRDGAATKYIVRQYFNTKITPDSTSVATSSRIYCVTGILGTP